MIANGINFVGLLGQDNRFAISTLDALPNLLERNLIQIGLHPGPLTVLVEGETLKVEGSAKTFSMRTKAEMVAKQAAKDFGLTLEFEVEVR